MTRAHRPLLPQFLRIAHRGASGHAPENTLAAFRLALELGTDALELDLHQTRDSRIIVIHDHTVDRTTNGHGRVDELTWAEIHRLDAGAWFDARFRGERVPRLEEVLDLVAPTAVRLLIEIKSHGDPAGAIATARRAAHLIQQAGLRARTTFLCFDARVLEALQGARPVVETCWLVKKVPARVVPGLMKIGARYLAPHWPAVTGRLVEKLHGAGYPLIIWTVDAPPVMKRLLRLGVDAIATNFPERLNAVLGPARSR